MLRFILILGTISLTQTFYIQSNNNQKDFNIMDNIQSDRITDNEGNLSKSRWHMERSQNILNRLLKESHPIHENAHQNHLDKKLDNFRKLYYQIAEELSTAVKSESVTSLEIKLLNKNFHNLKRVPRRIDLNRMNENENEVLPKKDTLINDNNNNNNENNFHRPSPDYLMVDKFNDYYDDDAVNRSLTRSRKCCDFKNFLMKAIFKRKTEEMTEEE